jgi:pyruvate,orthophosphate dikinase
VDRVEAGERDWFTKPLIDSYHTVWFELHEDLLSTLGKERASEESKELA